jgi:hypothetical protein
MKDMTIQQEHERGVASNDYDEKLLGVAADMQFLPILPDPTMILPPPPPPPPPPPQRSYRTGRWSLDEKILFLYGLRKFGKGRWKKISFYLPHRYVTI